VKRLIFCSLALLLGLSVRAQVLPYDVDYELSYTLERGNGDTVIMRVYLENRHPTNALQLGAADIPFSLSADDRIDLGSPAIGSTIGIHPSSPTQFSSGDYAPIGAQYGGNAAHPRINISITRSAPGTVLNSPFPFDATGTPDGTVKRQLVALALRIGAGQCMDDLLPTFFVTAGNQQGIICTWQDLNDGDCDFPITRSRNFNHPPGPTAVNYTYVVARTNLTTPLSLELVRNAGSDITVCNTDTLQLAAAPAGPGATGQWISDNPTVVTFTPSANVHNAVARNLGTTATNQNVLTWRVTTTGNNCVYERSFTATVVNLDAGPNFTACNTRTRTLAAEDATTVGGGTWSAHASNPGSAQFNDNTSPTARVRVSVPGVYKFFWTSNNTVLCSGAQLKDSVVGTFYFFQTPMANIPDLCEPSVQLTAPTPPAGYINPTWTPISPGASVNSATSLTPTYTATILTPTPRADSLEFSVTVNGCVIRDTIKITFIGPEPYAVTEQIAGPYCTGEPVVLQLASSQAGYDYTVWYGANPIAGTTTAGTGGALTFGFLPPTTGSLTFRIVAQNATCTAPMGNTVPITATPAYRLALKVMLEGPLNVSGAVPEMRARLNNGNDGDGVEDLLEDIFGLGTAAVDPTGFMNPPGSNMAISNLPINDVVDLIKVSLRSDATAAPVVADEAYAWLRADGTVVDFATASRAGVDFCGLAAAGNYYVVVSHRNHLAIMSAQPYAVSTAASPPLLDLTNPISIFTVSGETNGHLVANGPSYVVAAMFAGNNVDLPSFQDVGAVNAADYFNCYVQNNSIPANVYIQEDANLDGNVNATDLNRTRTNNFSLQITRVP